MKMRRVVVVVVVVAAVVAAHQNSTWWNFRMVNRSDFGLFRTKFLHPTSLCRFAAGAAFASEDAMSSSTARARLRPVAIFLALCFFKSSAAPPSIAREDRRRSSSSSEDDDDDDGDDGAAASTE